MNQPRRLSWDTETHAIQKIAGVNRVANPKMVCLTCEDDKGFPQLLRGVDACLWYKSMLESDNQLIAHNGEFDHMVMVRACAELIGWNAVPALFKAHENFDVWPDGQIICTKITSQLIDVAKYGLREHPNPKYRGYKLSQCTLRWLDVEIDKGEDTWRLRFKDLENVSTDQWPEAAVQYALADALWPGQVYEKQREANYRSINGATISGINGVENAPFQTMASLPLSLMKSWGIRVDFKYAQKLVGELEAEVARMKKELIPTGLVGINGGVSKIKSAQVYGKVCDKMGIDALRTKKTKAVSTGASQRDKIEDALLEIMDPEEAKEEMAAFFMLSNYERLRKFLSTYMRPMLAVDPYALHAGWNLLVNSGRTSCASPNLQNFPKHDKKSDTVKASRVRKCFIPRDGNVFLDADYGTLELCTLAQICYRLFNYSLMRDAINSGLDLHLKFACQMLGIDYAEGEARLNAGDPVMGRTRFIAKIANFGFPGGLQPRGFVKYARGWGAKISLMDAENLFENWMAAWPEMDLFFAYVRETKEYDGTFPIQQHGPDGAVGWRVRMCPRFPAACNTLFQGLAADGAKYAMFMISKACYVDTESPLYGFRLCAFVHDEFLLEGPEERASGAADELERIMVSAMGLFVPDVNISASMALCRRWDVKAESVRDNDGNWSIYEEAM